MSCKWHSKYKNVLAWSNSKEGPPNHQHTSGNYMRLIWNARVLKWNCLKIHLKWLQIYLDAMVCNKNLKVLNCWKSNIQTLFHFFFMVTHRAAFKKMSYCLNKPKRLPSFFCQRKSVTLAFLSTVLKHARLC